MNTPQEIYKRERDKLFRKSRKFGWRAQLYKYGEIIKIAFRHPIYDEYHINNDLEGLKLFIRMAERNYKLEKLGIN